MAKRKPARGRSRPKARPKTRSKPTRAKPRSKSTRTSAPRGRVVSVGGRVRVLRPRAPFEATVIRVNQTSITMRQDNGKRWRVKLTYPMTVLKVGDGGTRVTLGSLHAPPPPRTRRGRRMPNFPEDHQWTEEELRRHGFMRGKSAGAAGSVPQHGRAALAWMKAQAAAVPRGKVGHFMEGGHGFSGWIWAQVGRQKDIILSTNGDHAPEDIAKLEATIKKAIPGASTWISYD